jgi:hypothetical protein
VPETTQTTATPTTTTVPETTGTTATPTTTTASFLTPEEALERVEAYYRAINDGSFDSLRDDLPGLRLTYAAGLMAFNAVVDFDCRWDTDRVVCTEHITDDFYGPAGLDNVVVTEFLTWPDCELCAGTPGLRCPAPSDFWNPDSLEFVLAFDAWLAEHHPDARGWIWVDPPEGQDGPTWFGNPCYLYPIEGSGDPDLPAYLQEFIEWSDDYPVES